MHFLHNVASRMKSMSEDLLPIDNPHFSQDQIVGAYCKIELYASRCKTYVKKNQTPF